MIAAMHAGRAHTDESISTCRFAQRVAMLKNEVLAILGSCRVSASRSARVGGRRSACLIWQLA